MVGTLALCLYTLGMVLPPATVLIGLLLLAIPKRAEVRAFSTTPHPA